MFKKITCKQCGEMYDEAFSECPNCHAINESLDHNFKTTQMISWPKQIGLFAVGLGGFELLALIISNILIATGLVDKNVGLANMLLNTLSYAILFLSLLAITNNSLPKLLKSFKKLEPYIAGILCCLFIILTGSIYSMILKLAGVNIINNDNQQAIDSSSNSFPALSFIIFGFIGPICEELTYRVGLFSFSKRISKWLAYPVTIVAFALIHFNFRASSLANESLNLPYYILAGFALTFTYDKFGFAGSTIAHVLNNVISLIPVSVALGVF